jgi:hypothetical protein
MNTHRRRATSEDLLPLLILLGCCLFAVALWWPIPAVAALRGFAVPLNPMRLAVALVRGEVRWPGPLVFVAYATELAAGVGLGLLVLRRRHGFARRSVPTDTALPHLARAGELTGLTPAQVRDSAARLRPDASDADGQGVLLGRAVPGGMPLRMSWEDNLLVIAGPRVGKTTSLVIPPIVAHRGAVKTSSNKADVHDATRGVRERTGTVWLCDPQRMVHDSNDGGGDGGGGGPRFWFDPLADITSVSLARELVQILIDTTVDRDARPDAYFHPAGRGVLVCYVFAAALAGRTLADVDRWLGDHNDTTPAEILERAGYPVAAGQARSVLAKPDRQRDGVLGTAQSWLSSVTDPSYAAWITPPAPGVVVPRFEPEAFVRSSGDTLYLLSQHGPASAAAITTMLNAAVDRAAIGYARTQPGGRLAVPLLSVLDEAANTIRDSELPEKFSHYGSRGLSTIVMLQSWSQGVDVWRERGMRALASAANITMYLGGVSESDYLKSLAELLGERDDWYWTRGGSRDPRGGATYSRSQQVRRVPVLSAAELAALPRGRALLMSSGNRPLLVRPVPWMEGPHAAAIQRSLDLWETAAARRERVAAPHDVQDQISRTSEGVF